MSKEPVSRFKNVSGAALRVGRVDGPLVEAGDVTRAAGQVTSQTEDAYIVGEGDQARAWPKATWELLPPEAKTSRKDGE
ncbi:hypothetical protein [Nonomuraea ceibae]|uniref:hypothetical protein n=1 Tax=Nonomuraea ceibae TaxID=1935170 RepID=UPI001C5F0B0A|nr:hypothetical protein [Nonomuraea ceibae]